MTSCPFCGCDRIYPQLGTLRCKRCKGIWKMESGQYGYPVCCETPPAPAGTRKKTEPLSARLAKKLEECLGRSGGRYCPATRPWQAGDVSEEQFRGYLRQCVKNGTLAAHKDPTGRVWFSRP